MRIPNSFLRALNRKAWYWHTLYCVREIKIDYPLSYSVYFGQVGTARVILLCGGEKARRRKISKPLVSTGRTIGGVMARKRPTYYGDLLERLKDPAYAVEYLEAALEEGDMPEVFLLVLRNVAEVRGMARIARETKLNRENLYTMLSERGNPVLSSLYAILDALGMRLSISRKQAA
jgi:probable addiction module antidote protein